MNRQLELLAEILKNETPESLRAELDKFEPYGPTVDEFLNYYPLQKQFITYETRDLVERLAKDESAIIYSDLETILQEAA